MPTTTVDLGGADSTYTGGDGDYQIIGSNGNDTVTLGNGTDSLTLGNGNNTLTVGTGTDTILAGSGNNTVTTASGADTITLTDGDNIVITGDGNSSITLGNGYDQLTTGNGNSLIQVGNGPGDAITVGTGSNSITIGTGVADVVKTGGGGNTVNAFAASLAGDSIFGATTTGDGTTNKLVLTTAGTVDAGGVSGFGTIDLASGGANSLTLTAASFANLPGGMITVIGGNDGNTIDASALSAAEAVTIFAGSGTNVLTGGAGNDFFYGSTGQSTVDGGAGVNTMTFSGPASDYTVTTAGATTTVSGDGETDTLMNIQTLVFGSAVACFTAGTRIAIPGGEMAVEELQIGQQVQLARGGTSAIVWIGQRSYGTRFLSGRRELHPILIRAGALGGGLPMRDLRVSPLHAMFLEDVLIPAEQLVNGTTIVRDTPREQVDYFHVELAQHDLVLAEGAASETFLDDASRGMFHNAADYAALYPDAQPSQGFCAPRIESGYVLETVRKNLAAISGTMAVAA